jgi:hypothetical protein
VPRCIEKSYGQIAEEMTITRRPASRGDEFSCHGDDCDHERPMHMMKLPRVSRGEGEPEQVAAAVDVVEGWVSYLAVPPFEGFGLGW